MNDSVIVKFVGPCCKDGLKHLSLCQRLNFFLINSFFLDPGRFHDLRFSDLPYADDYGDLLEFPGGLRCISLCRALRGDGNPEGASCS